MANTVSLCMIIKNEIQNIKSVLDNSLPYLEEVVIADTGSTDGTLEILKEYAEKHKNLKLEHFDWVDHFAKARNYAFSKATQDWIFWLDGDDQWNVNDLLEFKNKHLDNPEVDCWVLEYNYAQYEDGSPSLLLGRERFLRRSKNPQWVGAIHETIPFYHLRHRNYSGFQIKHSRHNKVIDWGRNLRILEKEFEANKQDARTAYYYGKELFDTVNPKGIEVLEHYLTVPGRYWDDEVNARFRLGCHYLSKHRFRETLDMALEIYHKDDSRERAECYWLFGALEQSLGHWDVAIEWFDRCTRCDAKPPRVINKEHYTWHPRKRMAECYSNKHNFYMVKKCVDYVKAVLPNDKGITKWVAEAKSLKLNLVNGLRVIQINEAVRTGDPVYYIEEVKYKNPRSTIHPDFIPCEDGHLDGVVLGKDAPLTAEITRVIKPGGFLWVVSPNSLGLLSGSGFGHLGTTEYNGFTLQNYIRVDPAKPTIGYPIYSNSDFGPYRIRILNLAKSAIKSGYGIDCGDPDLYVADRLDAGSPGKYKILDVCEKLDKGFYVNKGIRHADLVIACTDTLRDHIINLFPGINVDVMDDHFELSNREWL